MAQSARRAILLTFGSHGDVHPFLGLGVALRRRGWEVTLATNAHFSDLIERHGLSPHPVGTAEEFAAFVNNADAWHPSRGPRLVFGAMARMARATYAALEALRGQEAVVVGSTLTIGANVFHERFGGRFATMHLAPTTVRSGLHPPRLPGVPPFHRLPAFVRERFYKHFWNGADRYVLDPMLRDVNALRREVGLGEPIVGLMGDYFHAPGLSLCMWPEWFAPPADDWPAQIRLCGFPLYDERETSGLAPGLRGWLDAGDAPVAFTPGSAMIFGRRFFEAAVGACERLGVRGLLLSRHGEHVPLNLPSGVRHEPFAPFGELLPQCRAIVHHGGVGTLSQALAAGVPQVIMPMAHDQPDNAERLERLGVARSLRPRRFTARRLSSRLRVVLHSDVQDRARDLAARIERDAGLERACDAVERLQPVPSSVGKAALAAGRTAR